MDLDKSTQSLVNDVSHYLTTLGLQGVIAHERWESDGVMGVYHTRTVCEDDNRHWYLWVTGNDNNDYPPGISLVLIGADPDYARDTDTHLTDLAHLPQVLTKYQFSLPG